MLLYTVPTAGVSGAVFSHTARALFLCELTGSFCSNLFSFF